MADPKHTPVQRAKRGPKPKDPADQLSQLTIRLTPKLKYGLEMLAKAQHRSLSQSVEWALQVGLNSFEIGYDNEPLGGLVDRAWALNTEAERTLLIYEEAPELLDFEERAACELVEHSIELDETNAAVKVEDIKRGEVRRAEYYRFVNKVWPAIRAAATDLANSGRLTRRQSLKAVLGLDSSDLRWYGSLDELATRAPQPLTPEAWRDFVAVLIAENRARYSADN